MRNLQSDIDVSVGHIKNINTTLQKDMQALSVNVFDHSEVELLQRQNKSASLSAGVHQHFSISITELLGS